MTLRARDLMTAEPITVRGETPLLDVLRLFIEAGIGAAPVDDDRGQVLGIVSTTDLLTAVDQACDEDADEGEGAGDLRELLRSRTAADVATPEPVWVEPDAEVPAIAQRMRTQGIHHALVGGPRRVLGMLSAFDLLRAVAPPGDGATAPQPTSSPSR